MIFTDKIRAFIEETGADPYVDVTRPTEALIDEYGDSEGAIEYIEAITIAALRQLNGGNKHEPKPDDPKPGSHWWIGTTEYALEWQASNGPRGKRTESRDFPSALAALAWACKPGVTVTFEGDFVARGVADALAALNALCTTVAQTGGMIRGEDIGNEPGENEDAPVGDPDWVDLGAAYLQACDALGFAPLYEGVDGFQVLDLAAARCKKEG